MKIRDTKIYLHIF